MKREAPWVTSHRHYWNRSST